MQTVSVQDRARYAARVAMQDAKAAWMVSGTYADWSAWQAAEVAYERECSKVADPVDVWA